MLAPLGSAWRANSSCASVRKAIPLLSIELVIRVFHEKDDACDHGEEHAEEKPKPSTSVGVLRPERTKDAEQK